MDNAHASDLRCLLEGIVRTLEETVSQLAQLNRHASTANALQLLHARETAKDPGSTLLTNINLARRSLDEIT